MHKLNELIQFVAKDKVLFLQPSDRNRENTRLQNESLENEENSEPVDDMSTWFGGDITYSFIFMFAGSVMSVLVFGCLIMLCYNHGKLQQIMTYFITTTPAEAFNGDNIKDGDEKMFLHIFYVLLLLIVLYNLIMLLKKLYNHFTTYNKILNIRRGHGLITGLHTNVVIEFCNLQHGLLVHVTQVQTPILLLTVTDDSAYPTFSIKPGHRLNYYLLLSNSILFRHYDCKHHIPSKTKFRLGMIQKHKLNKLLKGQYMTRVVGIQYNLAVPLTQSHESMTSGHLALRATPNIPPTQA